MMKIARFALLVILSASLTHSATALPVVFGQINFSGNGGLSGTAGSLLALTVTSPIADLAVATGSFSAFPTLPTALQPVSVSSFSSLAGPIVISTTSAGVTASFTPTTFFSSSITASSKSELLGGILSETGYLSTDAVLDITSVVDSTTYTATVSAEGPEPSSLVLLGTGLIGAAAWMLRRRRAFSS